MDFGMINHLHGLLGMISTNLINSNSNGLLNNKDLINNNVINELAININGLVNRAGRHHKL